MMLTLVRDNNSLNTTEKTPMQKRHNGSAVQYWTGDQERYTESARRRSKLCARMRLQRAAMQGTVLEV